MRQYWSWRHKPVIKHNQCIIMHRINITDNYSTWEKHSIRNFYRPEPSWTLFSSYFFFENDHIVNCNLQHSLFSYFLNFQLISPNFYFWAALFFNLASQCLYTSARCSGRRKRPWVRSCFISSHAVSQPRCTHGNVEILVNEMVFVCDLMCNSLR